MVVHNVMSKLSAAAAKTIRPYISSRVHHYPGGIKCTGIQEYNLGIIYVCFISFSIQYFYTGCTLFIFIIQHLGYNSPGAQCKFTSLHRSGQGRRLRAEVSAKWAAKPAFITVLATLAVLLRK